MLPFRDTVGFSVGENLIGLPLLKRTRQFGELRDTKAFRPGVRVESFLLKKPEARAIMTLGGSVDFRWNQWNIEHLAKHGVAPEEAEEVVRAAAGPYPRRIGDDKLFVR